MSDTELTIEMVRVRGWRVVLLAPRTKKPTGKHWQVTDDVDIVARHLSAGGNLGLICHESNGVAVLDADDLLGMADMIDCLGQPAAAWVETGRGRLHYYVAWCDALSAKITWKDGAVVGEVQRGPGQQQVVIPPSVHPDTGRCYRWLVDPVTQPLELLPPYWRISLQHDTFMRLSGGRPKPYAELRDAALRIPGAHWVRRAGDDAR